MRPSFPRRLHASVRPPNRRSVGVLAGLIAALLLGACLSPQQGTAHGLVNQSRGDAGRNMLALDAVAQSKAQAWAEHLAQRNTLAHSRLSDGMDGGWSYIAENVGYGSSVEDVHRQFMSSSAHRANVLDGRFTHLGVGVARGHGKTFVVHVLVRR